MRLSSTTVTAATALAFFALPAAAQAQADGPPPGVSGEGPPPGVGIPDFVSVGVLGAIRPTYTGSDNYIVRPLPSLRGRLGGFDFGARGPGLYVDIIREQGFGQTNIILGPLVRARFDRSGDVNDAPVEALGEIDIAVEIGGTAGVSFPGVFGRGDSLTLQTDITADIAGAHDGVVIDPSLSYRFPVGAGSFASIGVSTSWADGNYHNTYFGVTSAGSIASGLPVFNADAGFQDIGVSSTLAIDFNGNIFDGGWGFFALASYRRLIGDAADSPVTAIQGDADQFFGGIGLTYGF